MTELLARRALTLAPVSREQFVSVPVALNALTESIEVRLARPTTARPLAWTEGDRLEVSIVVELDGQEYRCTGRVRGGVRTGVDGRERDTYLLRYTLPWGFFGARGGPTQRLGERKVSRYTARVELRRLAGSLETEIDVESREAPAPALRFHNSVAFDAVTDAQEALGDGVLSLTHTSSGSDRGVFAGIGWAGNGGHSSTSCTYAGTGMTELWDLNTATFFYNAGYRLAGQSTGAQTVTSTLTDTAPDEHAFGVISMTGVDQTTPVGTPATATGNSGTASVTVGSVGTDDLVVDNLFSFGAPTVGANQTTRYTEDLPNTWLRGSTQAGADGGVMSWTLSANVWLLGAVAAKPAAGGQTIAVGQVTETDLAQPVAWAPKKRLVGQVAETDLAQVVARLKRHAVGQALEADVAQAVTARKTKSIGQVTETDLAQAITPAGAKVVPVDQVLETDVAQAVTARKTKTIAQVTETDLAQAITRVKTRGVGQVFETDVAQAVAWAPKHRLIAQVVEADLAQGVTWAPKIRVLGQALELDLAQVITALSGGVSVKFIRLTKLTGRSSDLVALRGRSSAIAALRGRAADLVSVKGAA